MRLKEGDVFFIDGEEYLVKDGAPIKQEKLNGPFGGRLVRSALIKDSPGTEIVIVGIVDDSQPRNNMVRIKVIKDRQGTPGERNQTIMLDCNTVVEIGAKKNG